METVLTRMFSRGCDTADPAEVHLLATFALKLLDNESNGISQSMANLSPPFNPGYSKPFITLSFGSWKRPTSSLEAYD